MPVNILYCEGVAGSPDISLLQMLLVNTCNVHPAGGKDNFSGGIQMARRANPALSIYGLRDRDFDRETHHPAGVSIPWTITENNTPIDLGWKWERRELENYLIDPLVVQRALHPSHSLLPAPDPTAYEQELNRAADRIAIYTAARTALSIERRPSRMVNSFHPHTTEAECRTQLSRIVNEYRANQPQEVNVLARFDEVLPACQPGGERRQRFLTYFSGKDLLIEMNVFLSHSGFPNWEGFLKAILLGMSRSVEPIWDWLPEWQYLRQEIINKRS